VVVVPILLEHEATYKYQVIANRALWNTMTTT
jgi:hypothetical protein